MLAVWPQLAFIVLCVPVFGILFWNLGVAVGVSVGVSVIVGV